MRVRREEERSVSIRTLLPCGFLQGLGPGCHRGATGRLLCLPKAAHRPDRTNKPLIIWEQTVKTPFPCMHTRGSWRRRTQRCWAPPHCSFQGRHFSSREGAPSRRAVLGGDRAEPLVLHPAVDLSHASSKVLSDMSQHPDKRCFPFPSRLLGSPGGTDKDVRDVKQGAGVGAGWLLGSPPLLRRPRENPRVKCRRAQAVCPTRRSNTRNPLSANPLSANPKVTIFTAGAFSYLPSRRNRERSKQPWYSQDDQRRAIKLIHLKK